ncbi:hypothetical protein PYW08_013613 [Mythimna loreyi]|uniref:Uncharacterized protein n=1 Tax=Mythimna loreyi TaxID=667449 RepID=A0ACC2QIS4_9NEOP|nr:hypothetical protein PYW08_013613 [Mythimna loreyi]
MDWRNAKILLASTATLVVTAQIVKTAYKYFFNSGKTQLESSCDYTCNRSLNIRNRDINDVILFSSVVDQHTIKILPNNEVAICESRQLNCFKLMKYLKSARETLDVCMYLITSEEIAEQIIRLGEKHVLVRIVADSDMAFSPPSQIKKLQEYSFIQVQTNKKTMLMHHKFCIIDGPNAIKRKNLLKAHAEKLNIHTRFLKNVKQVPKNKSVRGFVMSGSLNWSTQAMLSNNESVIVTSHPNIVGKFEKEFDTLWVENEPALTTNT